MGPGKDSDFIYCPRCEAEGILCLHIEECGSGEIDSFIRIPLALDHRNPERGLWGMVDWEKTKFIVQPDGKAATGTFDGRWWHYLSTDTPYFALLKALARQWGEEEY
jgi:hypothetical protein